MKLREKTLLITGLTLTCLILLMIGVSNSVIMSSYAELEKENTEKNVKRVVNALMHDISTLDTFVYDWAAWDDTYEFIDDLNEEYIESNLVDETFIDAELDIMLFVNSSGKISYGKAFDRENEVEVAIPEYFSKLPPNNILFHHEDIESSVAGIILLPDGPMIIVSRPILKSNDEGPVKGALIMGRYLGSEEIESLSEITHLSVTLHYIGEENFPDDFIRAISHLSKNTPVYIEPLSEDSIAGYGLLTDIYGNPVIVLKAEMQRDIYAQGKSTIFYFTVATVIIGIILCTAMLLLLDKYVLSRISRLSKEVVEIGEKGDFSSRVSEEGNDELSSLAETINKMLESLEVNAAKLKKSNEELEQFAYVVSHDLKEPVRMIKSYMELLKKRYGSKLDSDANDFIDFAVDGAERMQKLIEDLLAYSRVDRKGEPFKLVDCNKILEKALKNLELAIKETNAIVRNSKLPEVMGDETQLLQLFHNLISNAIKFRDTRKPEIKITAEKKENEWVFCFEDNGIGIQPENFNRIFMIFQRLHTAKEYPGTGIGLAICKKIVERHGGIMWVESEPGKGSRFYFTIPVKDDGH
ncbi:MAG TPA: HAMP domain-containing protein [Archaeoglobaceae archaeon]|nr:HAMP domain-containing protein [Archaeoglobaceae archaeon]